MKLHLLLRELHLLLALLNALERQHLRPQLRSSLSSTTFPTPLPLLQPGFPSHRLLELKLLLLRQVLLHVIELLLPLLQAFVLTLLVVKV